MMSMKESFEAILAEFGRTTGRSLTLSSEDDTCSFLVDDEVAVNLTYLPKSERVLAWASVGGLPEDELNEARVRRLLELNDGGRETGGFTLSLSREDRRIVAHDSRPVQVFDSVDILAAWVDTLVQLVKRVTDEFARAYPFWDDSTTKETTVHECE